MNLMADRLGGVALRPRAGYVAYALGLTFAVNALSNYDRTLISVLLDPIRSDLGLDNAQAGLLAGLPYALGYLAAAVPAARWGDRFGYVLVLAAALALWSGATVLCGLASGFATLLAARTLVGFGDAGHVPTSNVLTAAYVSDGRRGAAFSFMILSVAVGSTLALALGGLLNDGIGWRLTAIWAGVPGLAVAALTWFTLREPVWERPAAADTTPPDLRADLRTIATRRSLTGIIIGTSLVILAGNGFQAWAPTFLMRHFGMTAGQAGAAFGPVLGGGTMLGMLLAIFVADPLRRLDPRWPAWIFGTCLIASTVLQLPLYFLSDPAWLVPLMLPSAIFGIFWAGPVITLIQDLAGIRLRGTAFALFAVGVNVVGVGLGPLVVGAATDLLDPIAGQDALGYALLGLSVLGMAGPLIVLASSGAIPRDLAAARADP